MRRDRSSLRRAKPTRAPKRRFIIYCEGEKTEPGYFGALRQLFKNSLLIEIEPVGGVAMTVARDAVARAQREGLAQGSRKPKDSFAENDQIWAIFDRDEHPNFENAVAHCETRGVKVGRSNPCFELWLILHEEQYDRPDDRDGVCARLRELRPEYDPNGGKSCDWQNMILRLAEAEERAEKQIALRNRDSSPYGRPSTTVGRLTAAMGEAAEAHISR